MLRKIGALVVIASVSATAALAELPPILSGPDNPVPQCVTPGRLMAFLKLRNDSLDPRYDGIATLYMRYGEELGMRWDIAFYQMVLETGALSYWRGNRAGDVRAEQNNFAGLGATGHGVRGESFKDIETGVRAHLEHIMLYAGKPVPSPVADRTRKVQEWGILTSWQRSFRHPITYTDLAAKWAPGTRHYAYMIEQIADHFRSALCRAPDPRPELVSEARALVLGSSKVADGAKNAGGMSGDAVADGKDGGAVGKIVETAPPVRPSGEELAKRAIAQAKEDGTDKRSSLGLQPPAEEAPSVSVPYKVAGTASPGTDKPGTAKAVPIDAEADAKAQIKPDTTSKSADKPTGSRVALAGAGMSGIPGKGSVQGKILPDTALPPSANQRCRVWTASYGGQKSLIIRSISDQVVNFTVLDVNEGAEKREADAFIAAYAKNGKIAGEFTSQAQALDKAFELCPEG